MSHRNVISLGLVAALSTIFACSAAGGGGDGFEPGKSSGGPSGSGPGGDPGATSGFNPSTGNGTPGETCLNAPDIDGDGDGFRGDEGDCNDCDRNSNPGAVEAVGGDGPPADEDCDGVVDNIIFCDDGIAVADFDPYVGARALDLCSQARPDDRKHGVLEARYVRASGANAGGSPQVGVLAGFGPNVNVQGGQRMLAFSSGAARTPDQADSCDGFSCTGYGAGAAPQGFPQDVPNCPGAQNINDDVGLELKLRAPTNATGYGFNFKLYTFEYPEYICTEWNDQFITLVSPPPPDSLNGNISFDKQNNPVSVNIAFFDVCPGCALGDAELVGTGFDGSLGDEGGATSWLETQAPIGAGEEFTIRFAIWDTGDQYLDSTVLVDRFQWIADGGTVVVGTDPVADPK